MPNDNKLRVQVESRAEWRAWLAANHTQPNGVWLVTFKKHMGDKLTPAGLEKIEAAKRDGTWEALDAAGALVNSRCK
jgi:uncharacterized protein YdeI (YjbR/CyaY-like superfamily)